MRIAVISCWKYRDAWRSFLDLMCKFWPDRPYNAVLITDEYEDNREFIEGLDTPPVFLTRGKSWCQGLAEFCSQTSEPFLLMQEDFLLNAPVRQELVERGLKILERDNVGAVRLYPCPGSTESISSENPYYGRVARHTRYRTSCQATIWKPEYLHAIASRFNTPAEFEIDGSAWASQHLPAEVWAFKREVKPWPMEYLCSAIGRGLWSQDAKKLCDLHGIEVDWSMRGFQDA